MTERHESVLLHFLVSTFLVPFMMLFALYVLVHGEASPGGGFQGGAIFAAAVILARLSLGANEADPVFSRTVLVVLASLGDFQHKNWLWLGTILLFAVSLFLFAISPWFGLAVVMLFFTGMGDLNFVSLGTALLQLRVPHALLGRVMGLWSIGASFMFLGVLPMAFVGDLLGLRYALAGGALICIAFLAWLGVIRTPIRRMPLD